MDEESSGQKNWSSIWPSRLLSALLGVAVTVVAALIVQKLQSREPHLVYSSVETAPFNGQNGVVGIYQIVLHNDGKKELEDISCFVRIPAAKIEQYRTIVAPSLNSTTTETNDSVRAAIPSLNPGESAQISILASSSTSLPSRPEVSVRAKGVNGLEQTPATPPTREATSLLGFLGTAISTLLLTTTFYQLIRSRLGMGSQVRVLESICRTHGLDSLAKRHSTVKKVTYYGEADRLGDEAVRSSDNHTISSVKKILLGLCVIPQISPQSKSNSPLQSCTPRSERRKYTGSTDLSEGSKATRT
jgi:hypothetical protein